MAVVKGQVEPINMVEGPASLSATRIASPGHVPIAAAMPMIFSVNQQVVSFDGRFPVVAAVGDEILVAGTIKQDGMLHATAYENLIRAVGKTSVFPSILMPALYISTALGIPFFFWVMSLIQADYSDPFFLILAIIMLGSFAVPPFIFYALNQRMQRDAQDLANYARDHLLSRRD